MYAKVLLFFLLAIGSIAVKSQTSSRKIDSMVRLTAEKTFQNEVDLAKALTKPFHTDQDKAKAVFRWIKTQIRYDITGMADTVFLVGEDSVHVRQTLAMRRGICKHYAKLAKYMLRAVNIECEYVGGWSKILGEDTCFRGQDELHAWNVVKIDNKWQLMDCTWASNEYFSGEDNDFYFLTPPKLFLASHFPMDPKWQLTSEKYTLDDYSDFPGISRMYFDYMRDFLTKGTLQATEQTISFPNYLKKKGNMTFTLFDINGNEIPVEYQLKNSMYTISIPQKGEFCLWVGYSVEEDKITVGYPKLALYKVISN